MAVAIGSQGPHGLRFVSKLLVLILSFPSQDPSLLDNRVTLLHVPGGTVVSRQGDQVCEGLRSPAETPHSRSLPHLTSSFRGWERCGRLSGTGQSGLHGKPCRAFCSTEAAAGAKLASAAPQLPRAGSEPRPRGSPEP